LPIVSLKVIPMGVGTSVSRYIARVIAVLEEHGYKPLVTPDTTVIQVNDLSEVGAIARIVHDELYSMGASRIVTMIMIDDRRDVEERPPDALVRSVLARVEEEKRRLKEDVHGVL